MPPSAGQSRAVPRLTLAIKGAAVPGSQARCHHFFVREWGLPIAAAVVTFCVAEAVLRLLVHASDSLTPLIALPATLLAFYLTRSAVQRRSESVD